MKYWINPTETDIKLWKASSMVLVNHTNILEYLFNRFKPCLNGESEDLVFNVGVEGLGGEMLARIVLDIWNGSGQAFLGDMLEILDDEHLSNVLKALEYLKSKPVPKDIYWDFAN
jgi:hypothetical protein